MLQSVSGAKMITYQDVLVAIRQMPKEKRLSLMEELIHLLAAEMQPAPKRASSLLRVRGMLKPAVPAPSDHQFRDAYTDYIIEKYE